MRFIERCDSCYKFKFFDNWVEFKIREIVDIIIDPGISIIMSICPRCTNFYEEKAKEADKNKKGG